MPIRQSSKLQWWNTELCSKVHSACFVRLRQHGRSCLLIVKATFILIFSDCDFKFIEKLPGKQFIISKSTSFENTLDPKLEMWHNHACFFCLVDLTISCNEWKSEMNEQFYRSQSLTDEYWVDNSQLTRQVHKSLNPWLLNK